MRQVLGGAEEKYGLSFSEIIIFAISKKKEPFPALFFNIVKGLFYKHKFFGAEE